MISLEARFEDKTLLAGSEHGHEIYVYGNVKAISNRDLAWHPFNHRLSDAEVPIALQSRATLFDLRIGHTWAFLLLSNMYRESDACQTRETSELLKPTKCFWLDIIDLTFTIMNEELFQTVPEM